MAIFDRKFSDCLIHPTVGQGDFTTISTANLAAVGSGGRVFVVGSHTLVSDFDFSDNQKIYWDNSTLTMNGCAAYIPAAVTTGMKWEGRLTLGGTGKAADNYAILSQNASSLLVDASSCLIKIAPNYAAAHTDFSVVPIVLYGSYGQWNLFAKDVTVNIANNKTLNFIDFRGAGNNIKAVVKTLTSTNAATTRAIIQSSGGGNILEAYVDGVTDNTGNVGIGIRMDGTASSVSGSISNTDGANLQNGSSSKVVNLVYTP